jgi:hypothetical protein
MAWMTARLRAGMVRAGFLTCLVLYAIPAALAQPAILIPPGDAPRPPGLIPNQPAPLVPPAQATPPLAAPAPAPGSPAPATAPPTATPARPSGPVLPPSATTRAPLSLSARYGTNLPAIQNGLQWRIYSDRTDSAGALPLVGESGDAAPVFNLPPGGYVVHVAYGLAGLTRKVTIGLAGARETLTIPAGGVRMRGVVGDTAITNGLVTFEIFRGSQFDGGEKRLVADNIAQGDVILLPEGTYHIASHYGDTNATVRSDIRVQAGKLSDATVHHRAAQVTLKLVTAAGREALANTAWTVLTPGGDTVKESMGAFPVVVLAEGDYIALARNDGRTYQREFKVDPGVDREIEVLANETSLVVNQEQPAPARPPGRPSAQR